MRKDFITKETIMYRIELLVFTFFIFYMPDLSEATSKKEDNYPTRVYLETRACITNISEELFMITYIKNSSIFDMMVDFDFAGLNGNLYGSRHTYSVNLNGEPVFPINRIGHSEYSPDPLHRKDFKKGDSYIGFINLTKSFGVVNNLNNDNIEVDFSIPIMIDVEKNIKAYASIHGVRKENNCSFDVL